MSPEKSRASPRRSTAKVVPRKAAKEAARSMTAQRAAAPKPGSVIMQARIDETFARALVEEDAVVLGLDGPSALVREGLRLVHERAREAAMVAAYDEFYRGRPAPLPAGVAPATVD
jgi:hypothetical protein